MLATLRGDLRRYHCSITYVHACLMFNCSAANGMRWLAACCPCLKRPVKLVSFTLHIASVQLIVIPLCQPLPSACDRRQSCTACRRRRSCAAASCTPPRRPPASCHRSLSSTQPARLSCRRSARASLRRSGTRASMCLCSTPRRSLLVSMIRCAGLHHKGRKRISKQCIAGIPGHQWNLQLCHFLWFRQLRH